MSDNYLKESTTLIRKGCSRRAIQLLEKIKHTKSINKKQEMEILRRQIYCANKIIESYLHRNVSFYKKTAMVLTSRTKLFFQQWYDLIRGQFKQRQPNVKMIQAFLYELLKYTQNISLKYYKEESYHLSYYFCDASKLILEQIIGFDLKLWQHSTRDSWTDIILGNMLLQNQNFESASKEFENALVKVQKNLRQIISYKIEKGLTKDDVKVYFVQQVIILIHILYLSAISYFYSDNLVKYEELLKLVYYFHKLNTYNGEQSKILKDFIKQHSFKIQIYLQEQGEIQRIMSYMYDLPEAKIEEKPNYIDERFYQKYQIEQLNKGSYFVNNNLSPISHIINQSDKSTSIIIKKGNKKEGSPIMNQKQPLSQYYETTINIKLQASNKPVQKTQKSIQSPKSVSQRSRDHIKKESFSYIKSDKESRKYLDNQIQECLKRESFYSYNDVSKDIETNISMNSEESKQVRSDRSSLKSLKQRRIELGEINPASKMAIFNLIEAKSLYYMEVQKANNKLKNIQQMKDQQQKKMMSDKLISDMKFIQKQPSLYQSTEGNAEERDEKIIFKEVFNDLKKMADTYGSKIPQQIVRQRLFTQQTQPTNQQNHLVKNCKDLSKSIIQSGF